MHPPARSIHSLLKIVGGSYIVHIHAAKQNIIAVVVGAPFFKIPVTKFCHFLKLVVVADGMYEEGVFVHPFGGTCVC
jgi:hypothetical protein